MSVWFFGDSYCIESTAQDDTHWKYEHNWMDLVAQGLGADETIPISQFGVSNDWIFKFFLENTSKFKPGDSVVVQLTSAGRKWFLPNEPQKSNLFYSQGWTEKVSNAIDQYREHLHNDQLDNIQYTSYVYAIMFMTHSIKDVNFLILPGFDSVPGVTGNLTSDICNFELGNGQKKFFDKHNGFDPRLNHMSMENHIVLADKIVDYFKNDTMLDLTTGFKGDLY